MPNLTKTTPRLAALLASAAVAMPAVAQDGGTLTVATHYSQDQMGPLLACFDAYTEETGVEIEFQQASYRDFLQTILTARVGGTSPDIYNIYSIWAPQLASAGTLATPPEDVTAFVEENYGQGTVEAATIDGTIMGIPTELSVYQLIWNRELFEEAGYSEAPETWDELREIAAAITETNDQGNITTAGYVYGPTVANAVHVFYSQMYAAGTAPYSDDLSETNFTSPEAVEIVARQGALFADGITAVGNTTDDFPAGRAGMAIMANWQESLLRDAFGDAFEDTVGVAPIPNDSDEEGTMLYSFFWAVDSTSDMQEEAWDFLTWINTPREGEDMSCTGQMLDALGALTGNLGDLEAMDTDDSFTAPFVAAIESGAARTQPNIWQASENDRILRSYIEQVWAGEMTAEEAMEAADAEVSAILAEQE